MRAMTPRFLAIVLAASTTVTRPALAQWEADAKLKLVNSNKNYTPGIGWNVAYSNNGTVKKDSTTCKRLWHWSGKFEGSSEGTYAPLKPEVSDEPISVLALHGGGLATIKKFPCQLSDDFNTPAPAAEDREYGSFRLTVDTDVESDPTLRSFDGTVGVSGRYENSLARGPMRFVPLVELGVRLVKPLSSKLRDSLAAGDSAYQRLDAHVAWHIPIAGNWRLHANGWAWWSKDLPAAIAPSGNRRSLYGFVDIARLMNKKIARGRITEVFGRVVSGELPTEFQQDHSVMLGINYKFGQ